MGLANAQRTLYYIRVLTEFISQPEYRNLVPIFGIVNEALVGEIGMDAITSFYLEAHNMIREITGYGEGNGPVCILAFGSLPRQAEHCDSISPSMTASSQSLSGRTSWLGRTA